MQQKTPYRAWYVSVLQTANFQKDPVPELDALKKYQPDRPLMVMEFWTGWFDHWLAPFKAGLSPEGICDHGEVDKQTK